MKADREHRVPLSGQAVAILQKLPRTSELVFPGARRGRPLSLMTMLKVLKRMDRSDLTVHGFRSSMRDWAAECTEYPNHVVDMARLTKSRVLSKGPTVVATSLRRDAKLMTAWSAYCTQGCADNVVDIRSGEATSP